MDAAHAVTQKVQPVPGCVHAQRTLPSAALTPGHAQRSAAQGASSAASPP